MKRTLLVKDLPWPGVKLSQNGRSHWSAKAALVKAARQAIALWIRNGRIPLGRVAEVSRVTGIPKALLSPDFRD